MFIVSITLTIIAASLLVLVVLAQNPKGGGLSGTFGGSGSQLIGVKKTSDLLEKMTWGLAIAVLVFSLSSSFFLTGSAQQRSVTSPNIQEAEESSSPFVPGFEESAPGATEETPQTDTAE